MPACLRSTIASALTMASVSLAFGTSPASGAEPRGESAAAVPTLDDVVVTATRQATRLADAPVAATVLTRDFIVDARIDSLRQIDDFAPNVQFNQLGQVGGTYVTIRGIESNPFIVNRAAVYVDGIPFRELRAQALGEIEQIEVLRGPQGTLYGANTESGLIVIRTRAPGDAPVAELDVELKRFNDGEGYGARALLGTPFADERASALLVVSHERADSFVRNLASSIGEPGEVQETFVQGKIRWQPSPEWTVDALAQVAELRAPGLYEQEFLPVDRARYDANYSLAFNGGRTSTPYRIINDAPKRTNEDEVILGVNVVREFGGPRVEASLSWRRLDGDSFGTDLDLTALPAAAGGDTNEDEYWNAELRLVDPSARLPWVLGVNHYREQRTQTLATLAGPGGFADFRPAPPQSRRGSDYALFGQVTVPLGERLRLTAGARYERAEREKRQPAGLLDLGPFGQFAFAAEDLEDEFDDFLPRVALDWRATPELLVYASIAKGWIPGGFNLGAATAAVTRDFSRYGAESLWTYEFGAKQELFGGRALLSGAVFLIDARNWQEYNVLVDADGRAISTNLVTSDAEVRSRGFELELTARPTATLDVAASFGVVDAEYRQYRFSATQDFTGGPVKLVPEYDASFAASWRPWRGLFLRGEVSATGDTPLHPENELVQEAVVLANLQVGWESERWSARLFVDNVTDELVYASSAYSNFAFGFDGTWYAGVASPRVVGFAVDARW